MQPDRRFGESLMWSSGAPTVAIPGNARDAIVTQVVHAETRDGDLVLRDVDGGAFSLDEICYSTRDPVGLLSGHYTRRLWVRTTDTGWLVVHTTFGAALAALLVHEMAGRLGCEPTSQQVVGIALEFDLHCSLPRVLDSREIDRALAIARGDLAGALREAS